MVSLNILDSADNIIVIVGAGIIDKVDTATPRLLINREEVGKGYGKHSRYGFCFDEDDDDTTDVALLKTAMMAYEN